MDIEDCVPCTETYHDQPHLTAACASVGIKHGISTGEMLRTVLGVYHRRGHPADLRAAIRLAADQLVAASGYLSAPQRIPGRAA